VAWVKLMAAAAAAGIEPADEVRPHHTSVTLDSCGGPVVSPSCAAQ
jgi:hypothetical protein